MVDKAKEQYIITLGRQLFKEIIQDTKNIRTNQLQTKSVDEFPQDFDEKVQYLKDKQGGQISSLILKFISQLTQQYQLKQAEFTQYDQSFDGEIDQEDFLSILSSIGIVLDKKQHYTILRFFSVNQCYSQDPKSNEMLKFNYREFFAIAKLLAPHFQSKAATPIKSQVNKYTPTKNQVFSSQDYSSDKKSTYINQTAIKLQQVPQSRDSYNPINYAYQTQPISSRVFDKENQLKEKSTTQKKNTVLSENVSPTKFQQLVIDQEYQSNLFLSNIAHKLFCNPNITFQSFIDQLSQIKYQTQPNVAKDCHQMIVTYVDFQKYLRQQLDIQYSIDDISELLFQWIPKNGDGLGFAELELLYQDLMEIYQRQTKIN
eukprot:403365486